MSLIHVVGAAIVADDRCLIARRAAGHAQAGRWEFPGGKVEPGESPHAALEREIREELGIETRIGALLGTGRMGPIRLDVYQARHLSGAIRLTDHDAVHWLAAHEIDAFEFAEADVPVLPALRALLDDEEERASDKVNWIGCDWSTRSNHRAVAVARLDNDRYEVDSVSPPAGGWELDALVEFARAIVAGTDAPCVVGIDVSLGIPYALGQRIGLGFRGYLAGLDETAFENAATTPKEWAPTRPFFRIAAGTGGKQRFIDAAGGDSMQRRQFEILTGANPTFALSGIPGVVGGATRSFWQALRSHRHPVPLWPFDGRLDALLERDRVVLAEAYPKLIYGIVLADALPAPMQPIAKTKADQRRVVVERLGDPVWARVTVELLDAMSANENDFDAAMLALGLARLGTQAHPLARMIDRRFEGALLGSGAIDPVKA